MSLTVHCPSCGAPTELRSRAIQVLVCPYCDQTVLLTRDGAEAHGKVAALTDLITDLSTGAAGTLQGRTFTVTGRVRFTWSDGYWDEWWILFDDGTDAWLHEDEGELSLLRAVPLESAPSLDDARVGQRLMVNRTPVYVTEKREAVVYGAEGQLPRGMLPGQTIRYVDGTVKGEHWMLEARDSTVELFVGSPLEAGALEVLTR